MTNEELQTLVQKLSLTYFSLPFQHQAIFNGRLKTTGGRYHLKDHHLDFNPKILNDHGMAVFIGIIKHELCHYHLHLANQGYRHSDRDFKELLKATGGLRFAPVSVQEKKYNYSCQSCQQIYQRARKIQVSKFRCGKCQGRLSLVHPQLKKQMKNEN